MAKLKKISKRKGTPPLGTSFQNLKSISESDNDKILNFKVSAELKKRFKQFALDEGVSMRELFLTMFDYYTNEQNKEIKK